MNLLDRLPGQPFLLLLTVPAGIAVGVGILPFPLIWLERAFPVVEDLAPAFHPETARSVLGVVAAGAMTALALTYSITLVVFTLAAGAIGPRLLRRFISDPVSQASAGVFGGAFVFSMTTLAFVTPESSPRLAVVAAMLLGVHVVLQLVFFVRHVAGNVSIDDEVAAIAGRLETALRNRRERYETLEDPPDDDAFDCSIEASRPGYVGAFDEQALVEIARKEDLIIRIDRGPGRFVLEGEPVVLLSKNVDEETRDRIGAYVVVEPARSEGRQVEFSMHLLVEIALRALSPGVNDVYTAIAVSDSISGAIADDLGQYEGTRGLTDSDGKTRLIVPELSQRELIGQAYHPLRQAGAGQVLMCQALARAFSRIYAVGGETARDAVRHHVELLMRQIDRTDMLPEDVDSIFTFMPSELRRRAEEAGGD